MRNLILLGASGNAREILDVVDSINKLASKPVYKCLGFLDDNNSLHGEKVCGIPVLGPIVAAQDFPDAHFVNAIGSVSTFLQRESIIEATRIPLERFATIVHPLASVSRTAYVGRGTVVLPHVFIGSDARVGDHVLILSGSAVNHDVVVGDCTCITSGACISGKVKIGRLCYLGTNCSLIGSITVNDYVLIGMGSVVLKDVPRGWAVVGNPARFLRYTVREEI